MFSGLRENSLFYILDKSGEAPKLKIGQVLSVSNPQTKFGQYQNGMYPNVGETFVDVKVKAGDEELELKQLPSNGSIHGSSTLIVSDSREAMSAEVEGLMRSSRQILDSIPYHEKTLEACDTMLRELNPHFAKEKAQEEKIGALEEQVGNIQGTLGEMMNMLSSLVGKTNKTKSKEE